LIVGAAEGLGGKLMRTVSFLGWTLPVSFFGGTAPPGVGIFSAINYLPKLKLVQKSVNRIKIDDCRTTLIVFAFGPAAELALFKDPFELECRSPEQLKQIGCVRVWPPPGELPSAASSAVPLVVPSSISGLSACIFHAL
jgi:hypothetical protein